MIAQDLGGEHQLNKKIPRGTGTAGTNKWNEVFIPLSTAGEREKIRLPSLNLTAWVSERKEIRQVGISVMKLDIFLNFWQKNTCRWEEHRVHLGSGRKKFWHG